MSDNKPYVLTAETVEILSNFARINNQTVFNAGSLQRACNQTRNFIADVEIDTPFPKDCALYELNRLLGIIDICKSNTFPTISFGESSLVVNHDNGSVTIPYAHADVVAKPPSNKFIMSDLVAQFKLPAAMWTRIKRTASILQTTSLYVVVKDGELVVKLVNEKDKGGDSSGMASFNMPDTQVHKNISNTWAVTFDTLELLPGDYNVSLGEVGNNVNNNTLFGMFFFLDDPNKRVTYLTSGHVVKTR